MPRSAQVAPKQETKARDIDVSALALVSNWRAVIAALIEHGIDLYDPAVRARPWPGIRTLLFSIIDSPSPLRGLLTRR